MPRSEAHVQTSHARRYLTQLCEHFALAVPARWTTDDGFVDFGSGNCRLTAGDDKLLLHADGVDTIHLAQVEYLVGEHLERFGARESLAVDWRRADRGTSADDPSVGRRTTVGECDPTSGER
ncbi:DUF2218 domain-containing protein [Solwaraspora sp. WMMD406]|uniref:DUF2218 domain-containing protein n=1 Tax=Solwaraspora sp. WMMD406 TaxID=3016095 RepID=UPI0024163F30|nr:DUF2218 domain-containing protein [Solwaraspora sp. WMMD406]MDG4763584.1 DUF2218 domain-containing protein [Solwaraspora sp. WMMD406]